jgi:septum formation protein
MIYLASRSPRRRLLLGRLGIPCETLAADIDESWDGREPARAFVSRLALEKARVGKRAAPRPLPVLAADTEVVLDGRVLGKPESPEQAVAMLMSLAGREHLVCSAVALLCGDAEHLSVSESRVAFRPLAEDECLRYWESGEPADKAGGYAIQGRGAAFVTGLTGSYSGVVGLPLAETAALLGRCGIGGGAA